MTAYYNEHDPEKADALRWLMRDGWIAPGDVDERDIRDVTPGELSGYAQCHFFAGIGLWSVAARRAGIPDDFPLWSGSCPCQPFSAAGRGDGVADERHLFPHWHWLVSQRRPHAVVGEQVASRDGLAWLDIVRAAMEGTSYSGGALDLCSAGFGAPNIRQRLYMCWLADARRKPVQQFELAGDDAGSEGSPQGEARQLERRGIGDCTGRPSRRLADANLGERGWIAGGEGRQRDGAATGRQQGDGEPQSGSPSRGLVNGLGEGLEGHAGHGYRGDEPGRDRSPEAGSASEASDARGVGDAHQERCGEARANIARQRTAIGDAGGFMARRPLRDQVRGPVNGFWAGADWLLCRDPDGPKLRPTRSGAFVLAPRHPGRNGELRAYGDAINLEVATAFLAAVWPEMKAAA